MMEQSERWSAATLWGIARVARIVRSSACEWRLVDNALAYGLNAEEAHSRQAVRFFYRVSGVVGAIFGQ
jgi:hypothetical protein